MKDRRKYLGSWSFYRRALALLTDIGPVALYSCIRLADMFKIIVFHNWLKQEKWLRNLTKDV